MMKTESQDWNKIKALIVNTLIKEFHHKTLLFLMVLTVLIMVLTHKILNMISVPLEQLSINIPGLVEKKMTAFYTIISVWNSFLALFMGVQTVKSDFENKTIDQILCLPINRLTYMVTRLLGTWLIIMIYYSVSLILAFMMFTIGNLSFDQMGELMAMLGRYLLSLLTNGFTFMVLITVGILFSLYLSKFVSFVLSMFLASLITFSNLYVSSLTNPPADAALLTPPAEFTWTQGLAYTVHYVFPRLGKMNELTTAILQKSQISFNIPLHLTHFVFTYFLLGALLIYLFQKKDIH